MTKRKIMYLIIAGSVLALVLLFNKFIYKKVPITYPDFGITLPRGYQVHGIDVSRYQKAVDWKMVSGMRDKGAKIDFVFVKSTEGLSIRDSYFDDNWPEIKKHNMIRGAYHFFHPRLDGKKQANFFIEHTPLKKGDLAPVVDIEDDNNKSKPEIQKQLFACLDVLEKKFKCKPIIYCNADFYRDYLDKKFDDYPLWVAHYKQIQGPEINRDWHIWQHHDNGHVNGIEADVDFNALNGSYRNLLSLCIK